MEKTDVNKFIDKKTLSSVFHDKNFVTRYKVSELPPYCHDEIKKTISNTLHTNANKKEQSSDFYQTQSSSFSKRNGSDDSYILSSEKNCICINSFDKKKVDDTSSNEFHLDTVDLAERIEFCLLFGYTSQQIRNAILKVGCKASKNDILAELSSSANRSFENSKEKYQKNQDEFLQDQSDKNCRQNFDELSNSRVSDHLEKEPGNCNKLDYDDSQNLRPIIIDGSNVAMSHGNKQYFSSKGILLAVNYFRNRCHRDITVFVPNYRVDSSKHSIPTKDPEILFELENQQTVVFTPSRNVNGKRVTCYDDRFILKLAEEVDGVIVSNNHFQDLQNEKPEWKQLIEKRLLMYSFVNDRFMPPDDPLGRNGPNIDNFLRKRSPAEVQSKPQCPYGRKCNYGKKCKYFHPEYPRPSLENNETLRSKFKKLSLLLTRELIQPQSTDAYSTDQKQLVDQSSFQNSLCMCSKREIAFPLASCDRNQVFLKNEHCDSTANKKISQPLKQLTVSSRIPSKKESAANSQTSSERSNLRPAKLPLPYQHAHTDPLPSPFYSKHFHSSHSNNLDSFNKFLAHGKVNSGCIPHWPVGNCQQQRPHVQPGIAPASYTTNHFANSQMVDPVIFKQPQCPSTIPLQSQTFPSFSNFRNLPINTGLDNLTSSNNSFPGSCDRFCSTPFQSDPNVRHWRPPVFAHQQIPAQCSDVSSTDFDKISSSLNHRANTSPHVPLTCDGNSRYNLFRHLCVLYPRQKVETVMTAYPNVKDPARIIKLMQKM